MDLGKFYDIKNKKTKKVEELKERLFRSFPLHFEITCIIAIVYGYSFLNDCYLVQNWH